MILLIILHITLFTFVQIICDRNLVGVGFTFSYLCEYLHLVGENINFVI